MAGWRAVNSSVVHGAPLCGDIVPRRSDGFTKPMALTACKAPNAPSSLDMANGRSLARITSQGWLNEFPGEQPRSQRLSCTHEPLDWRLCVHQTSDQVGCRTFLHPVLGGFAVNGRWPALGHLNSRRFFHVLVFGVFRDAWMELRQEWLRLGRRKVAAPLVWPVNDPG